MISSMLMKKKPNSASQAFRMVANSVQRSNHWLGDYFRRMKTKGGNRYAIVATAKKIATIYYKMVGNKVAFSPLDLIQYQEKRNNAYYLQLKCFYNELEYSLPSWYLIQVPGINPTLANISFKFGYLIILSLKS